MPPEQIPVNPSTLARQYGLRVTGGKMITWEVFFEFLEKRYWERRNQLLAEEEQQAS